MIVRIDEEKEYNPETDCWDGAVDSLFVTIFNHKHWVGISQLDIYNGVISTNNFCTSKKGFYKFLECIKKYITDFNNRNNTNYDKIIFLHSNPSCFYKGVDFKLLKKVGEDYYYEI